MERFICLVIGYAFGLIQSSYIIGRLHNVDIRQVGSGNAGTTNALRTLGVKAGLLTLFMDTMKCILAILLVRYLFKSSAGNILPLLSIIAAAGCILGHNFPFYLNFKGGKGIACTLGMMIAIDPFLTFLIMFVFLGLFFTTHYVSLCSIVSYLCAMVGIILRGAMGHYGMDLAHTIEMDVIMVLLTLLALYRHRSNIQRLLSGTERKTYLSSKHKEEKG